MEQTTEIKTGTGNKKKIIIFSVGTIVSSALAYFGYQWWQKKKQNTDTDASAEDTANADTTTIPNIPARSAVKPVKHGDDFPLKKGSKGDNVKQLQQALIDKNGSSILPKYGADGEFGKELETALTKLNYPVTIDENTFNVLVKGGGLDAASSAKELYLAALKKDAAAVIKSLQKLKSKEDYAAVSETFKNSYRINGVRQTLVNGILNSFTDENQKQAIRLQFTRMGLNYDGKKWSLSGLNTSSIITTATTLIWINPKAAVKVPANMILGREVTQRGKYTVFENNNQPFLVATDNIARIA